ncbi:hypothetical protein OG349_15885 [Streptomyces sp. NBC_01317]|uniref:hypothetical protein n=1 Tax=Streptomyces sp. NBC_01317 TaxID=2903822 RepID=UPI002E160DC7|nr:hypothetical protein OG349_15885 [Streptomyces sp. NBC_01317]
MPFEEPYEDKIGHALRATGDTFEPADWSTLVDGGLARGRRKVARRRSAAVTGGVLALAVIGVGGAYGGGLLGGTESGGTSLAVPALSATEAGLSGADLTKILTGLLPGGTLSEVSARGAGDTPSADVSGVFDDGKGPAAIAVVLTRVGGKPAIPQMQCPDQVLVPYESCSHTQLPDGSALRIFQGYEGPDLKDGVKRWQATRMNGRFLVDVTEYNAPAEKGAQVSRPEPPLGTAELRALVTSKEWNGPLRALPTAPPGKDAERKVGPSEFPEGAGGTGVGESAGTVQGTVRETFLSLLPKRVKVLDHGGQEDEYAYAVVDDGKGAGFVQVNVQPDMLDVADELYGEGATTLPDGTLLKTTKEPSEKGGKGAVMWTADTMRPDGLRVVVSALNADAFHADATRKAPVLSIGQLTALATSEKWLTAR